MTQTNSGAVAIFDSGLGMLSILPHIRQLIPAIGFECLADQAYFPYGGRSEEDIRSRMLAIIPEFVRQTQPALIILACNTASTSALNDIRKILEIPVVGVVPAIKPAASLCRNGITGLLATHSTVNSPYTNDLIKAHASHCKVIRQGSNTLAECAEAYRMNATIPNPETIRNELDQLITHQPDTVALACTHFPLILSFMKPFLPNVRFWTEPGPGVAQQVKKILSTQNLNHFNNSKKSVFWSTSKAFVSANPFIVLTEDEEAEIKYFPTGRI